MPSSSLFSLRSLSRLLWILLALSAVAGTLAFFIPAFIIRPFTHQSARGLWWAVAIRQRAPITSLICWILCILAVLVLWQASTIWRKMALVVVMLPITFSAVMSRMNYFEWMFHPIDSAQFESALSSKLGNNEMILAVRFGDDARAYPILQMAYHHVLNDVVGGVPIAVTY